MYVLLLYVFPFTPSAEASAEASDRSAGEGNVGWSQKKETHLFTKFITKLLSRWYCQNLIGEIVQITYNVYFIRISLLKK